jgi:hypothetical protein
MSHVSASLAVGPLPVSVIQPAQRTALVTACSTPQCLLASLLPARFRAVPVPAVTLPAQDKQALALRASPLA